MTSQTPNRKDGLTFWLKYLLVRGFALIGRILGLVTSGNNYNKNDEDLKKNIFMQK